MKVVTLNILVDFDGDRTNEFIEANILLSLSPDIIMIQELHYKRKKDIDIYLKGYVPQFSLKEGMGCMIYVKEGYKVNDVYYKKFSNTFMDRGIYAVNVSNEVSDVWYITTHLESMDKPQFERNRQAQLLELWDFIKDKEMVVLGMDSNIKDKINTPCKFLKDIWEDEPIPTWFSNRFFDYSSECRFDRILLKNLSENIIEKDKVTNKFSDHDILCVTFA